MPASGEEIRPRRITNEQVVRTYHVIDAPTESDVATYVGTLPSTLAGFPFSSWEGNEIEECEGADEYMVTVTWGVADKGGQQQPAGTSSYRFSFQAPSAHIKRSLATISGTESDEFFPFSFAPNFGGAINVVDFGTVDVRTEGFDLQPPAEVFSIPYTDVDAVIDGTYQALVRSLCGKVNNATFYGYAAGEIMLVRADGQKQNGLWNLEFGFGYIPNATNIPVGDDIVVPAKDGMDLLWVLEMSAKDNDAKAVVKKPAAAYVERVWERADLTDLNLP